MYAILSKYLSIIGPTGRFYRRPVITASGNIKYSQRPIGEHTLGKYMKTMFEAAGINVDGRRITNHSARVTQITTLLNQGHDNFDIKQRSGHRSDAVDRYKRPSNKRKYEMSAKLDVTSSVNDQNSDFQPRITRRRSREIIKAEEKRAAPSHKLRIEIHTSIKTVELVYGGKVSVIELSWDN